MFLYISPPNLRKSSVALFPPPCVRVFLSSPVECSIMLLRGSSLFVYFLVAWTFESFTLGAPLPFTSLILSFAPCTPREERDIRGKGGTTSVSSCTKLSVKAFLSILLKTEGLFRPLRSPFFYFLVIATKERQHQ